MKNLFFFQTLQIFERTFTVLCENFSGRDIKIENCTLCLQSITLKIKFFLKLLLFFQTIFFQLLKILFFFQTLQIFERTFTVLGDNFSGRDIKIENCTLCLQSIILKIKNFFWKFLFFFQTIRHFERTFTVLVEKVFGRDIKIEKKSFRLIRSIKKSNFWKFSLFIKFFRTLNEHLPCLAKKFWAGLSKLKIVLSVFRISRWGQK